MNSAAVAASLMTSIRLEHSCTSLALVLPVNDWQFWAVSFIMVVALYRVIGPMVRSVLPNKNGSGSVSCPHCASGSAATTKPRKTKLTIEGRKVR